MTIKARLFIVIAILVAPGAIATTTHSYDRLIAALIVVESNGNDRALGDRHMNDKAYGPLQIRKLCVDDVNRRFGTKIRVESLLGNRSLSVWVCEQYLKTYGTRKQLGREPTEKDLARIWNGGPSGWRKESTLPYWSKVEKALKK